MNVLFTADTHFGHANIIKYSKRPFRDVHEMDNMLIHNWNAVVGQDDVVYHLGDFSLGSKPVRYYRDRLNGKIHLIVGNHENKALDDPEAFASVRDYGEINVGGQRIVLLHYGMRVWNKSHHGSWHLYGHSHGSLPDDPNALSCDVGVDCWNYTPVAMHQLKALMAKKTWKPIDHHVGSSVD